MGAVRMRTFLCWMWGIIYMLLMKARMCPLLQSVFKHLNAWIFFFTHFWNYQLSSISNRRFSHEATDRRDCEKENIAQVTFFWKFLYLWTFQCHNFVVTFINRNISLLCNQNQSFFCIDISLKPNIKFLSSFEYFKLFLKFLLHGAISKMPRYLFFNTILFFAVQTIVTF